LAFLDHFSEIWPRFKLVGLKNFSLLFGIFDFISSWLASKNMAFWLFFGLFYAEISFFEGK